MDCFIKISFCEVYRSQSVLSCATWVLLFNQCIRTCPLHVIVLFTSQPYPLCRSSRLQMFYTLGVLKNFANFIGKGLGLSLFLIKCQAWRHGTLLKETPTQVFFLWNLRHFSEHLLLQNTSGGCFYDAFHECFFFYFSLAALPVLLYGTVTFHVWRNTFTIISPLLHHYYHNSRMFIRIAATATTYSTTISMIVIRISALMEFMLKRKKIYE